MVPKMIAEILKRSRDEATGGEALMMRMSSAVCGEPG
jgi:hypothetical protein